MPTEPTGSSRAPCATKFSLAANYDPELVPELKAYPVDEVYGKLPGDGISGGRPRYLATPLSEANLRRYVGLLGEQGIAFNYLLNGACFGNREWTRPWQKRVTALLTTLGDLGVRRVTVSTPFLLELVKRRFPEFRVRVGIYAQVDTPRRARFWEDLGADAIVLESFSINRNFPRLEAIRQAVDCDLELIANHSCLLNCPLQSYHQNGFAHASGDTGTLFIDYCLMRCSRTRLTDPSQFIKSAWIRPEDIAVYEAMGYTTFKLLERGIPSTELLRRVKAYSERRFEGNLAELLLSYGFKEPVRKESRWMLRNFWKPRQVSPLRLKPLTDLARLQGWLSPLTESPIRIDASQIPDTFLDGFRARDCASLDCRTCGYCEGIAAQAVSISPGYRAEVLKNTKRWMTPWQREGSGVFDSRATAHEFLDRPDCDPELAAASYRFMELVNGYFGGIRVVRRFLHAETAGRHDAAPLRVLDIGSGSCDIPLAVSRWAQVRGIPLHFTCLEMADHAMDIARGQLAKAGDPAVRLLQEDVFSHHPAEPYDCAVASMCFHHFSNEHILALLRRLRGFVRGSVLINDLRRSRLADFAARLLLTGTGMSAGVRHDALLSIRRGFTIRELKALLGQLGGTTVSVAPARWFRIAAIIRFNQGENT